MKISLGCDHAGFPLKQKMVEYLHSKGHEVIDNGCFEGEVVDFPQIAKKVCGYITDGTAERGIMVCGSGVGAVIACNKIKGIRATCCHDLYSAHQSVEHDDVNVACFGADVVGLAEAFELADTYLAARFWAEEEFVKRVEMLKEMDYIR